MGDLSENFSRHEWQCKCGNCDTPTVDAELIRVLQTERDFYKKSITVTPNGGHRCKIWNAHCKGSKESQHIEGRAADITVEGHTPEGVYMRLCRLYPGKYGIGLYDTFVHIDTKSGGPRRWDNRSK